MLYSNISAGVKMMLWGFFMKLVVGDRAGIYVDTIFSNYLKYAILFVMIVWIGVLGGG